MCLLSLCSETHHRRRFCLFLVVCVCVLGGCATLLDMIGAGSCAAQSGVNRCVRCWHFPPPSSPPAPALGRSSEEPARFTRHFIHSHALNRPQDGFFFSVRASALLQGGGAAKWCRALGRVWVSFSWNSTAPKSCIFIGRQTV